MTYLPHTIAQQPELAAIAAAFLAIGLIDVNEGIVLSSAYFQASAIAEI